jgi:hypothetical protein
MADYYPLLAKALANLPSRTAPTARRAIYERARKALIGQLRSIQPPMAEADIVGEDAALDKAIARLEAEYGGQPGAPSAPITAQTPPSPVAATPKPAPLSSTAPAAARPSPTAPRPTPAWVPKPKAAASAPPAGAAAASSLVPAAATNALPRPAAPAPPPRQPMLGAAAPIAAPSLRAAPSVESIRPPAASISRAPSISLPPSAAQEASGEDDTASAPAVAATPPPSLGIPPSRSGAYIARPNAPTRVEAPRRNTGPLVAVVLLICVAATALTAYLWRERPQDVIAKATSETVDDSKQPGQNKIAERIKGAGQSDPAPIEGETPIPTVTVPVAPVQVAPPPGGAAAPAHLDNAQSAPAAAPAPPATSQAQAQATPQPQAQTPPAAASSAGSRAAMLIGVASDPQKPLVNLGTATWSIIPASPGQPSTLAVRVEIDVPDQKMHATVTIRKNADVSLPATHTIDLRATFTDGAEIKGLKDMGLPQLRKDDAPTGDPLSGVRVKINDGYYLVGLTRSDSDAAHNLDLLATRNWLDFPLLLNDDRIAKLTFSKGETGDHVMAQALDAWK